MIYHQNFKTKIQSEEDMTQRVAIYSLLSSEGSTRAENVSEVANVYGNRCVLQHSYRH